MDKAVLHEDVKQALEVLKKGGVILYPSDLGWAIGCNATDVEAVRRVCGLRKLDDPKSMTVLIDKAPKLQNFVSEVPELAWDLIELSDKPITIIYDGAKNIANNLIADDGTVGILLSTDMFAQKLLERFKYPMVCAQASIIAEEKPLSFKQIAQEIKQGVDYVVKSRQDEKGLQKSGSIVKLSANNQVIIIKK